MLIDTDNKLVVFRKDTVLTLEELWNLVYTLEPDEPVEEVTPTRLINPEERDRYIIEPKRIYDVPSFSDHRITYSVVEFTDYSWSCSCPNFLYRLQSVGAYCKHMNYAMYMED